MLGSSCRGHRRQYHSPSTQNYLTSSKWNYWLAASFFFHFSEWSLDQPVSTAQTFTFLNLWGEAYQIVFTKELQSKVRLKEEKVGKKGTKNWSFFVFASNEPSHLERSALDQAWLCGFKEFIKETLKRNTSLISV